MFERYTERARRVIFFARYEASQFGSTSIETEHLLLGLLREDKEIIDRFLKEPGSPGKVRHDIQSRLEKRPKTSTSLDMPLSHECKRILAYAAEEAEALGHLSIGVEHLVLGILRETKCGAAEILAETGLTVDEVREELSKQVRSRAADPPQGVWLSGSHQPLPELGVVPDAETALRIADAIWRPLYGDVVAAQIPAQAELKHSVWIVTSAPSPAGAMFVFILQKDGRILSVGREPVVKAD